MRTCLMIIVAMLAASSAAGQGRPHLQVLNDIPESQLFLVMNGVAQSLGVGCPYCHVRNPPATNTVEGGWLFDRDDKPAKAKGREMMRMVRDLNRSQYGGRPVVTCYTCHRGETRVANLPPLPPVDNTAFPPPAVSLPTAQEVLQRYTAAIGTSRFATIVMEARDERSEGRRGEVTISLKGSDRYLVDLRMPPQPVKQGFSGAAGWVQANGRVQTLPEANMARLRRQAARYAPFKVLDPVDALHVDRIEAVRGRDAYAVVATLDASTTHTYFFDIATGLLTRDLVTTATALVPLQDQADFDDYRSVDGVMLPFLIRSADDAPYDTSTKTFTSIKHDVPLDDAVFATPRPPKQH
jgi:hypothetical protein